MWLTDAAELKAPVTPQRISLRVSSQTQTRCRREMRAWLHQTPFPGGCLLLHTGFSHRLDRSKWAASAKASTISSGRLRTLCNTCLRPTRLSLCKRLRGAMVLLRRFFGQPCRKIAKIRTPSSQGATTRTLHWNCHTQTVGVGSKEEERPTEGMGRSAQ